MTNPDCPDCMARRKYNREYQRASYHKKSPAERRRGAHRGALRRCASGAPSQGTVKGRMRHRPDATTCAKMQHSHPVAGPLKQAFADWIDQRTGKGVKTYGRPLETHNGRNAARDAMEELLDFCQYQQQRDYGA